VLPERRGEGIGRALIESGAARWREAGARGVVVLGDSAFYARFGFIGGTPLRIGGPLSEYFQVLAFAGDIPDCAAEFAPAFGPVDEPNR
jgi:putative acetyltransferase